MSERADQNWFQMLWERKVPQLLGSYLAIGFGLLQFFDFVSGRFDKGDNLVDKFMVLWLLLIPAVVILSFFRGRINPRKSEKVIHWPKYAVGFNVLAAIGLSLFLFNDRATQNDIENLVPDVEFKETQVPTLNKVKSVACFQFDNISGIDSMDWLGVGLSHLLSSSLEQRPEFYAASHFSLSGYNYEFGMSSSDIPNIGIQREIAQKSRKDFFTRLDFTLSDDEVVLSGQLISSKDGKEVISLNATASSFYDAIDEIKDQIFANIPEALDELEDQISLPSSALFTENENAFKYFILSRLAFERDPSDLETVIELARKAIEIDPTCAMCHFYVGDPLYGQGKTEESIESIKRAIKLGKSLPDRMQFGPKLALYSISANHSAYLKLLELRRKMFPYDYGSYSQLIDIYKTNYGIDSAKFLVNEAIENGNREKGFLDLFSLQVEDEEYEAAVETLDLYESEFPDREQDRSKRADIYTKQGDFKKAKLILEELETLDPFDTGIQGKLGTIEFKQGDVQKSIRRMADGLTQANSIGDSLAYIVWLAYDYSKCGRVREAFKELDRYERFAKKVSPQIRITSYLFDYKADLYLQSGQMEEIGDLISDLEQFGANRIDIIKCRVDVMSIMSGMQMYSQEEFFMSCRDLYQTFGDGYGELFDIVNHYRLERFQTGVDLYEAREKTLKKIFTDSYFILDLYDKAGERAKAIKLAEKTIDAGTYEPIILYKLASLLEKTDPERAIEMLEKVMKYWDKADSNFIPAQKAKELMARLST